MEKTVKRVVMPILVLVMIAAAFMGAFAFTNTASAAVGDPVAVTESNATVASGVTVSDFKPVGEGIPTDGTSWYKKAGLGLKFSFSSGLNIASVCGADGGDANGWALEYWFWSDKVPTNGWKFGYVGGNFSQIDAGNTADQGADMANYTPRTWQKISVTNRGPFGSGAINVVDYFEFMAGNIADINCYIYNPTFRVHAAGDGWGKLLGDPVQVLPTSVAISEGTVVEGVRTLNKYFVDGAPDFTLTAAADNLATNNAVTWSSANDEIATVTADGTVHLVSAGEVVLTASAVAAAVKSEIKLVVTTPVNPVTAVTINDDASVPAEMGGSKKYTADLTTASGEDPDDTTVVWTVTNGTGSATVAGIPVLHIVLFAGGMVVAIGALIAMHVVKRRRESEPAYDDDDDE